MQHEVMHNEGSTWGLACNRCYLQLLMGTQLPPGTRTLSCCAFCLFSAKAQREALRWAPKRFFQQGHLSCFFLPGALFRNHTRTQSTAVPGGLGMSTRFVPTQR